MNDNKKPSWNHQQTRKKPTKHEENKSQPQLITDKVKAPPKTQQKYRNNTPQQTKQRPTQLVVGSAHTPPQQSIKIPDFLKQKIDQSD